MNDEHVSSTETTEQTGSEQPAERASTTKTGKLALAEPE